MKERIETEFQSLIEQFEGYFTHFNANASALHTMMASKTDAESQERFKNAQFTAVEWEHLAKNNALDNSLKRTCSKILAILDLDKKINLELNQDLVRKVMAIPGFSDAYENYTEVEVFVVDSEGNLQEKTKGAFESFVTKTKEVTAAHYKNLRENIKQELQQFN